VPAATPSGDLSNLSRPRRAAPELAVEWLGLVDYAEALAKQEAKLEACRRGECGDTLLLLEHPPVITLGSAAHPEHLLESAENLRGRGIEVVPVRRGGDVTYHAPGQLVGYCITDLRAHGPVDLHAYLRRIEAALIEAVAVLGVEAERVDGMTGVFVRQTAAPLSGGPEPLPRRKLASIGVGVRHWISYHGFALNVCVDLAGFDAIIPCGLENVEMTSLARETGASLDGVERRVREAVSQAFCKRFGRGLGN
jgi:lipoyl(octanoyl) transferase